VYQFPPGSFNTAETRALQQGIGSYFTINMTSNPTGMPILGNNMYHAIPPQRLSVAADTPARTINLSTFAVPVDIIFPMDAHVSPLGNTASLFRSGTGVQGWQDMMGEYSFAQNNIRAQASTPGTFSGVVRQAPVSTGGNSAVNTAMQGVASRLTITDMHSFDPNEVVSANAFNNIVNAVANRRTTVTLNANLSNADRNELSQARWLAPQNLTREAATDILVRMYERQTGQSLTPMSTLDTIPGGSGTSAEFQRSVRIAADLGFITGPFSPQANLTMGDLMHMLNILMVDAGW